MDWTRETLRQAVRQRLAEELFIVVSNREPYVHRYDGVNVVWQTPPGGLTLALNPVMQACGGLWIAHGSGEADRQAVDAQDHLRVPPDEPAYTLRRVWLTEEEQRCYYYGLANEGLWPLCHIAYTRPRFDLEDWEGYQAVNRKFADVVLQEVGDRKAFVFIQDYHFALLSRFLKRPNIRTAQFWHIPWPNPEVFRICPWATEILDGLLGNDLLGFQVLYHCQNFMDTVDRLLEARVDREHSTVTRNGVTTMVRPFPISVDFEGISRHASSPAVQAEARHLTQRHRLKGRFVALGVDRIDYTKGIPERFKAVDRFLDRHPELHERFVFVEIGVPSRTEIPEYRRLNDELQRLVQSINWHHGTLRWKPVIFLNQAVSPMTLHAWYGIANACLVTSLHDGMNLVAKEFVACRNAEDGVLILSSFTGAGRELTDAVFINPYGVDEIAERLFEAVSMAPQEQQRRMRRLRALVREHDIFRWAGQVLSTLFRFDFEAPESAQTLTAQ